MPKSSTIKDIIQSIKGFTTRNLSIEEWEGLEKTYIQAFRVYSDKQVMEAFFAYMDDGEYYPPKPAEIKKLIKGDREVKHARDLIERWTCSICRQKVSSITIDGGPCVDCAGLVPLSWDYKPMIKASMKDYVMEARIKCQQCGRIGLCIKEPRESGEWQCRQCYTGLSGSEIAERFKTVENAMGKFKFSAKYKLDRGLSGERVVEVDHMAEMARVQELKRQAAMIIAPDFSEFEISDDDIPF